MSARAPASAGLFLCQRCHLVKPDGLLFIVCSVDPFSKKDWYEIKAPGAFTVRNVGKTLVTRTAGTKVRQGCWCGVPSLGRYGVSAAGRCLRMHKCCRKHLRGPI